MCPRVRSVSGLTTNVYGPVLGPVSTPTQLCRCRALGRVSTAWLWLPMRVYGPGRFYGLVGCVYDRVRNVSTDTIISAAQRLYEA